ncbi:MAG: hypothetical protein S4CHLAM81_06290 [Chlamydiales bacterium]|nr:hypothetical protein [Chlamydiales bacterium]MCH9635413.1 hypothetical protein [Chlamydiales bacterium]
MQCRFCQKPLKTTFCDLGKTPLANEYPKSADKSESFFPLHAYVCDHCFLVQLQQVETPSTIFSEYAYFSSFSSSWLEHAKEYADMMRPKLTKGAHIVEIASNDGYLLRNFKEFDILGIEPAENVADQAIENGIPTLKKFFGVKLAKTLKKADLIIGNNVLAHVPDLNDFVAGLKILLAKEGTITLEFPHLERLMESVQFDTIYHEHFSYFSLTTLEKIFEKHQLEIFDVQRLKTHGGSLRLFVRHPKQKMQLNKECDFDRIETYKEFTEKVKRVQQEFKSFIAGKNIVAYGAPAKGNTFLNSCHITANEIPYTVDRNPYKQNRFLPGTKIPIHAPEKIRETKPDYVLILPWNLKEEIMGELAYIREWGGKFVTAIPKLEVV